VLSHKRACLYTLGKVTPSLVLQTLSEIYTVPLAKFAAAYPTPTLKLHQMFSESSKSKFPGEGDALTPLVGTLCACLLFKLTTSHCYGPVHYSTTTTLVLSSSTITSLNGKSHCESTPLYYRHPVDLLHRCSEMVICTVQCQALYNSADQGSPWC